MQEANPIHARRLPALAGFPTGLFIGGTWQNAESRFSVTNPADGQELAQVSHATADDAVRALDAAVAHKTNGGRWPPVPGPS